MWFSVKSLQDTKCDSWLFIKHKDHDSCALTRQETWFLCVYRSEGVPLTCYFIPGRDGTGAWTIGNLRRRLPPFLPKANTSDIAEVKRPACGEQINNIKYKFENNSFPIICGGLETGFLTTIANIFSKKCSTPNQNLETLIIRCWHILLSGDLIKTS